MKLLRGMFDGVEIPDPCQAKVTDWHIDPFALGAYSFMPANSTVRFCSRYRSGVSKVEVQQTVC